MKILIKLNDRECLSIFTPTQAIPYPKKSMVIFWVDSQDTVTVYNMDNAAINMVMQKLFCDGKADLTAWEAAYNAD